MVKSEYFFFSFSFPFQWGREHFFSGAPSANEQAKPAEPVSYFAPSSDFATSLLAACAPEWNSPFSREKSLRKAGSFEWVRIKLTACSDWPWTCHVAWNAFFLLKWLTTEERRRRKKELFFLFFPFSSGDNAVGKKISFYLCPVTRQSNFNA